MILYEMFSRVFCFFILILPCCLNQSTEEAQVLERVIISNYTGPLNEHTLGTYFDQVGELQIKNSTISDLAKSTLKLLSQLESLTIVDTTIQKSEDDIFVGCCPTLRNLKVNQWFNFEKKDLQGIGSLPLVTLVINNQKLPHLEGDIFKNADLRSLSLDHNGIKMMSNDVFEHLDHLEKLSISWNSLDEVPKDSLRPLKKLKTLKLETDRFQRFSLVNLTFLPELTEIFLNKKNVKEINLWGIQEKAPKLKNIFLVGDDGIRIENLEGPIIHY